MQFLLNVLVQCLASLEGKQKNEGGKGIGLLNFLEVASAVRCLQQHGEDNNSGHPPVYLHL